jgi:hypothetical protein
VLKLAALLPATLQLLLQVHQLLLQHQVRHIKGMQLVSLFCMEASEK